MNDKRRKAKRAAAMLLAALMVVSSVDLSAFTAYAEQTEQLDTSNVPITGFKELAEDVSATAADGYDEEGFCEAYEWVDGTLTKKADADCEHDNCNGYQPATLEAYDVDGDDAIADDEKAYKITNAGQLYWFAAYVNMGGENLNANAYLANDITVNEDLLDRITTDEETGEITNDGEFRKWVPIGSNRLKYKGVFNGNNHSIKGVYICDSSSSYQGMFGDIESGATIKKVVMDDNYVYARNFVGGICSRNMPGGTVEKCTVKNSYINGNGYTGGICGTTFGIVKDCTNESDIKIRNSGDGGGITAENGGKIIGCLNTGNVVVGNNSIDTGGIAGKNYAGKDDDGTEYPGVIENCVNEGKIEGNSGIVAWNIPYDDSTTEESGTVINCYDIGETAYGICYFNIGNIENCYTRANNALYKLTYKEEYGEKEGVCKIVFYLSETGETDTCDGTTAMTAADFASGKVAYLLQQAQEEDPETGKIPQVWYQNIDSGTKDSYPVLDSTHGKVYQCLNCTGVYSNTENKIAEHTFSPKEDDQTKHICKNCNGEEDVHTLTIFVADNEQHTISGQCVCGEDYGVFTLSAPAENTLTYDGTAKEASVSGTIIGVTETPTISYFKVENETETSLTDKPTDAGTYKASISCGSGENTATAYVTYEIIPATPTVTWSESSKTVTYTANPVSSDKLPALTVTGVNNADIKNNYDTGDITYSYRVSGSDEAFTIGLPTTCGTYEIKATVQKKGNYAEAKSTDKLELTIEWLDTEATATLKDQDDNVLTGNDWWAKSVTFTAPDGYTISWNEKDAYEDSFIFSNNETDTGSDGMSYTYYLKKTDTGEIAKKTQTVYIDRTAPTFPENGGITIGDTGTWWKELLNTITFGRAYRNTLDVKVCGSDALSGVDKYYYCIDDSGSTTVKSASELGALPFRSVNADGFHAVKVATITNDNETKDYVVYAYAVDKVGNRSGYICSDGIVVDDKAPTLTLSTPTKDDGKLTDSSATITLNTSEVGTYFYILKEDKEAAPSGMDDFATGTTANGKTTWEAKSGVTSGSMAEKSNTLTLTGLEAKTDYVLYVMAVDSVGNASASVESKAFTTLKQMPTITMNPQISGTYGQKLSDMSLENGKAEYNGSKVEGTWTITETDKESIYPTVNGTAEYEVTFTTKDTAAYQIIPVKVIPTVAKKSITVTVDNKTKTYGTKNPEFTFTVPDSALVGTDTVDDLGIILSCEAGQYSDVKEGGYAITGTSNSANYAVTVTEGILTINKPQNTPNKTETITGTYTVRFNGNGSTGGAMTEQEMTEGAKTALKANKFKKKGYKFVGWNTKANGTGKKYKNKEKISSGKSGEKITLYAKWKKK